jgi:hypothetical protein
MCAINFSDSIDQIITFYADQTTTILFDRSRGRGGVQGTTANGIGDQDGEKECGEKIYN